jgi:hypothetical protein
MFLHQDGLSDARRKVRDGAVEIKLSESEIRRVCSSLDFAGVLVRHNSIDQKMFLNYWGTALVLLASKLEPLADQLVDKGVKVREYYENFWWLMNEATRRARG